MGKKRLQGSDDSMDSTPEAETRAPHDATVGRPKRKGGRKPVCPCSRLTCLVTLLRILQKYATSKERNEHHRQAQGLFRERRKVYLKQLEETIRVHETNLHKLQTAHRSAMDECLVLRYNNSLLEGILLEKGSQKSVTNIIGKCIFTDSSHRHRCPSRNATRSRSTS